MLPVMKRTELLPEIPEAEQTPLVKQLVAVIEQLAERVGQLEELTAQLKDERLFMCFGQLRRHG
jgi:hypothetical protein